MTEVLFKTVFGRAPVVCCWGFYCGIVITDDHLLHLFDSEECNNFYLRKRSCRKIMFLHPTVCLSTGGVCVSQLPTPSRSHLHPPPPKSPTPSSWKPPTPRGSHLPPPGSHIHPPPPPEMATEAGGTHPTGMHTC